MSEDKIPARDNSDLELMANPLQSNEGSEIRSGRQPSLGVGNRRSVLEREAASALPADTGFSKITGARRASALEREQAVAKADALPISAEVDVYNRVMAWFLFGNGTYSIVPIVWTVAIVTGICLSMVLSLIKYFSGKSTLDGTQIGIICCVFFSRILLGVANLKFGYHFFGQKEFNWEFLGHGEDPNSLRDQTKINRCLKVAAVMPVIVLIIYYIIDYTVEYEGEEEGEEEESTLLSVLGFAIIEFVNDSVHVTYLYFSYLWVVLMYSNYLQYTREVEPLAVAGQLDDLDEAIYMMTRRMERQNEYWKWNHIIRVIAVIIYVAFFFDLIYSGVFPAAPAYDFALMMSYGTCWGMVAVSGVCNDHIREGLLRSLISFNADNDRDRARVAQIIGKTSASFRGSRVGGAIVTFRLAVTFGSVFIAGMSAWIKLSNLSQ
jgi:hypothetical protein